MKIQGLISINPSYDVKKTNYKFLNTQSSNDKVSFGINSSETEKFFKKFIDEAFPPTAKKLKNRKVEEEAMYTQEEIDKIINERNRLSTEARAEIAAGINHKESDFTE